jgi:hypothetical protein
MGKHYKVDYTLVYEGGSKLTQSTTLIMESESSDEAKRKIRSTNNITSNVRDIQIDRISSN